MTLSVLISVYASEKALYLDRALCSVWTDQTLKPTEIVLIEDGPLGSELLSIIEKWKCLLNDRLVIIINEQNSGLTKSLNRGLKYIKSDLIARMGSDDISEPLRFEKQVSYMNNHPEIDVLGGAVKVFNDFNNTSSVHFYPLTPALCRESIFMATPVSHPAVMMRRKIFDIGIRYNEKYRTSQDIALWFELLVRGYTFSNLSDVILSFRKNDNVYLRRKSFSNILNEFKIYMYGIYSLKGIFTWKYIYPMLRLFFRLLPIGLQKKVYTFRLQRLR